MTKYLKTKRFQRNYYDMATVSSENGPATISEGLENSTFPSEGNTSQPLNQAFAITHRLPFKEVLEHNTEDNNLTLHGFRRFKTTHLVNLRFLEEEIAELDHKFIKSNRNRWAGWIKIGTD